MQEKLRNERRNEHNERQRFLMTKFTSEKGGVLTKDVTDQEIEKAQAEFYSDLAVLDYKCIDVAREDWGFEPDDDTTNFGENMENRCVNFIKNHIVRDESGNINKFLINFLLFYQPLLLFFV